MATTTNQFEKLLETQNKMMESWMESSQKMMNVFSGQEEQTSAKDLFSNWYDTQKDLIESTASMKPEEALSQAPETYRKMMEAQIDFAEKWSELYQQSAKKMGMAPRNDFTDMLTGMKSSYQQMQDWMANSTKMMQGGLTPLMPANMVPYLQNFTASYNDMAKYWEPLSKAIQSGISNPEALKVWFPDDAYKQVVDTMMGFSPMESIKSSTEQAQKLFSDYYETTMGRGEEFSKSMMEKMGTMPSMDMSPWMHLTQEVNSRIQQTYAPFTAMMNQGKETEMFKEMKDLQFDYINFTVKAAELQSMVYESGKNALPETVEALYEATQNGDQVLDYDAFFKTYIGKLEDSMTETFKTDEYTKLQASVASVGLSVKSRMDNISAMMFENTPFTLQNTTDELAGEVHALRQKLRSVERKLNSLAKGETAAAKPARTTTRRKTTTTKK